MSFPLQGWGVKQHAQCSLLVAATCFLSPDKAAHAVENRSTVSAAAVLLLCVGFGSNFSLSCKDLSNCTNSFLCLPHHGRELSKISWAPSLLTEIGCLIGFVMQHPWQGNWMLIWHFMQFFLCFTWINVHMNCFNACINTNMQVYTTAWNTGGERNLDWNRKE